MEIYLPIFLLFVIGLFLAAVLVKYNNLSKKGKEEENSQKIFLDLLESIRKEVREVSENYRKEITDTSEKTRKELGEKLEKINEQLLKSNLENLQTIQNQFKQSSEIIKSVSEKLTKLDETNKQVLGFSEKLENLEDILKNPKKRGVLGEYFLETLLSNFFAPSQFQMQYKFKNGDLVDAVIFFNNQIIPIDSKFSLEKYNEIQEEKNLQRREELTKEFTRDVKNRIDETSKYIRPEEKTTDFAFMFIPAEGVYYALLNYKTGGEGKNMIEYAFSKRVIITSPSSFFAYIQTVIQGLKMLKFQEDVKGVLKNVSELGKHLSLFEDYFRKIGNNLSTTVNSYNLAYKEFGKVDKDIVKISGGKESGNVEVLELDKPNF